MKKLIILDGENLKIEDIRSIIQGNLNIQVSISEQAKQHIVESRGTVDMIVQKKLPIYGISTGFGKFKEIYIPHDQMIDLQKNLIVSHAACVGEPLLPRQVLLMLILRLNCLVRGNSGVRLSLLYQLEEAINKQLLPKVPCQGSVGASGDLAPLSHLALGLMGIGEIWDGTGYQDAKEMLKRNDFVPLEFMEKEGLAMNNGTQMMASLNIESLIRTEHILNAADIALAITAFVTKSNIKQLVSQCGGSEGREKTLDTLRRLLRDVDCRNGVNAKSIQSALGAHGVVRDSVEYGKLIVEREMNSTSDNPVIDNEEKIAKSGGNFHGEYMAMVADMLCIGLQRIAIFSERRQERLVNSEVGQCGLPMFLTGRGGILNGYMIPQYTSAAIVSENKILSHPSCVDTVPTSANIEDHVSMGAYSARKALQMVKNLEYVVAVELMCSCQALEFYQGDIPQEIQKVRAQIRDLVPDVKNQDIFMSHYMEKVAEAIRNNIIQY